MPPIPQLFQAIRSREAAAPRSILGFFGVLFLIVVCGGLGALIALAQENSLHHLIGPILIFVGALAVVLVVGVFFVAWNDPTKLMLGQVSTRDLIEYRKLTLGSSATGERLETVAVIETPSVLEKESADQVESESKDLVESTEPPMLGDNAESTD
jgi:hypothetical protein